MCVKVVSDTDWAKAFEEIKNVSANIEIGTDANLSVIYLYK